MQKKIRNLVAILVILLIIILTVIVILQNSLSHSRDNSNDTAKEQESFEKLQEDPSILINGKKLEEVKSEGVYFTIDRIINKYYSYITQNNSQAVYQILYEKYINEHNINTNNALQFAPKVENYKIIKMYGLSAINYGIYYIQLNSNSEASYLMINWDMENDTYSICPIEEAQYNNGLQNGIEVNKDRLTSIEKNSYNSVVIWKTDNDSIAEKYFYDYMELIVNSAKEAYDILDENYKNKNFETYKDFAEFIMNNINRFRSLDHNNFKVEADFGSDEEYQSYYQEVMKNKMTSYSLNSKNGIKTYTYKDSYGKYYVFKVTAAMQYTVLLDTYTIPTVEFSETYNKSSETEKVVINIKRFFDGINDKNYGYAYSVLSDGFKTNSFANKNDFVNYAKQNFFEENKVEYVKYEKQNDLYIYQINLTDATGNSQNVRNFNIIMRLKSGTDFEMSFGTD